MAIRAMVLATEVTLSGATNLDKATCVRVLNDTAATIVATLDDTAYAVAEAATEYVAKGARNISIAAGETLFVEKYPTETIDGAGLKCTKVAKH